MILGTAGHIDHGKTTLVRALSGVDTDRLKEEKARGISIELGYAYVPLDDGSTLGIIDVPGHEKFVHTMVAGAAGIDTLLLVVAADDGVMPQTREHLAIAQLLGVKHGCVAITKADRVDEDRLQAVQAEVTALLADTPYADAPRFTTAATQTDDPGVTKLREHLWTQTRRFAQRDETGLFRLAVDRVFTLPGQGTVVTGTVFAGRVQVGDTLMHSGSGVTVRVRSLHANNRASDQGRAGQRCALNLAGIAKDAIQRGDWIAAPGMLQASDRLDTQLTLTGDAPELRQWTPVHVHLGTWRGTAHVALLETRPSSLSRGDDLARGQLARSLRVQLVMDAQVHALPGDRFILRNAQANQTIAGGHVLDPYAPARKRGTPQRMAYLNALQTLIDTGDSLPLLAQAPYGLSASRLQRLNGGRPCTNLPEHHHVRWNLGGDDALLIDRERVQTLQATVLDALRKFHTRLPDEPGVNAARLRRMALPELQAAQHDALWQGLVAQLLDTRTIARNGAWLHLPEHRVQLDAAEQTLAERLEPAVYDGGFDPPWVRDLARDHRAQEAQVRQLLNKLARQGRVYQVVKDLFYSAARMAELAEQLHTLAQRNPRGEVSAAEFRDATGLGRKRAIQVLEYFDRIGYTRRQRDAHLLRPGAAWTQPSAACLHNVLSERGMTCQTGTNISLCIGACWQSC